MRDKIKSLITRNERKRALQATDSVNSDEQDVSAKKQKLLKTNKPSNKSTNKDVHILPKQTHAATASPVKAVKRKFEDITNKH